MNSELEQLISSACDLPVMPVVATKVMQLVEDERVTATELARVVAADPTVAARVLKISNSAMYGRQRQIQTLAGAITLLGFNTVRSLVVTASVKDVFKPFGLTEKMLWEHSIGAGLAAHILASDLRRVNSEEAFLAGLLHDVGKLVMHNTDPKKFQKVMENCFNEGVCFEEAEKRYFPFSHAELGGFVLRKWNLPEVQVAAVAQHHTLHSVDPDDPYQQGITAIVSLADMFCGKLGIGERSPRTELALADSEAARILALDDDRLTGLLERFQMRYEQEKSYFS